MRQLRVTLCLMLFDISLTPVVFALPVVRYHREDTIPPIKYDTLEERDVYDIIAALRGRKRIVIKDSIGKKPVYSIIPALGYTLQSKIALTLAGNVEFRLSPAAKISTIIINSAYTQTRQLIIPVQSSIWTKNNGFNFVGDFRYLKYPESTWGLGSSSSIANEDPMDYSFGRFEETVLKRIGKSNFYAGPGVMIDAHWNITHKGPLDGAVSGYSNYGAASHTLSSGITMNGLFDSRDNPVNPQGGFYAGLQYRNNAKFIGSTSNWQSLIIDMRKYYRFPSGSRNILAIWSYDWLVLNGNPPYLDLPANTWDTFSGTGRGYIQGRFRGAQMVYLESEYRFRVSRNGLFGGVVFVNAQSFSAKEGTRLQGLQPAFGPGLRLKLNKISKTNIAIDYGIGREGSKGVFINVGEIF